MLWAQDYAYGSRAMMNRQINGALFEVAGKGHVIDTINCHHNFTQREQHHGKNVRLTRPTGESSLVRWVPLPSSLRVWEMRQVTSLALMALAVGCPVRSPGRI